MCYILKKEKITKISITGVFCALAFIMTVVLRFKVSFLSFDLKDAVLGIVALMYGPIYGVVSAGMVAFLEFLSVSDTGVYGLIMNFISTATFTFIAGIIYKFNRTFRGAILAVIFSVIGVACVMMLANILITPYYMGVTADAVIKMIPTLLLPFNICKATINAAATVAIYKPVRGVLKKSDAIKSVEATSSINKTKSLVTFIVAILIIIATVFLLIKCLGGQISLF